MMMNTHVMNMERWKLHGNISQNGYGNAIIGRYGGYFEEDIKRFMCDRAYHITGLDALAKFAPHRNVRKGNARYRKRLGKCKRVRVHIIHGLTLVIKNSHTYCKSLLSLEAKYYYACP